MGEGGNWGEGLEMVKKEKRAGRKREEMVGVESAREMDGAGGERESEREEKRGKGKREREREREREEGGVRALSRVSG